MPRLTGQEAATLAGLLAYCVALTVKPVRDASSDRLAAALSLDMAQWWQPTGGFFGRMPKDLILGAVAEGVGPQAAKNIANMKKGAMAEQAAALLQGTGWLPALLRAG